MKTQKFTAANGTEITIEMFPTNESTLQSGEIRVAGARVGHVSFWENEDEVHAHYDEHPDYTGRGTSPLAAAVNLSEQVDMIAPNVLTLKTEAVDNHGHHYDVEIQDVNGKPVFRILGTPGGWYMETLNSRRYPTLDWISIDAGQDWNCINILPLLAEANAILEEV